MSPRNTAQRAAILDVLTETEAPLGIEQILSKGQQAVASLSQATVYRILKQMMDRGHVATVQLPGQTPLYELSGKGHHHFFRCWQCEQMFEVTGCEGLVDQLVPRGFALEDHDLFLYGLCATCRRNG
ncbi:MAG: transcriptional repressor [Planctomycetes bacterium]|jgi:Fur family ferric uptake transcriptional regulator|nr:transcriptional repressor [Phycisphaerae bacterium]NBB95165.1 transcriptional repressor [Planctomycetota bacterium]